MADIQLPAGQPVPVQALTAGNVAQQFQSLIPLLTRASASFSPMMDPEEDNLEFMTEEARVLVIGAGGLGCELLKNLALSGFRDIEVIDLDTIELSNLNRQFLFRKKDIGEPKSHTAAKFVMERVPGCKIVAHHNPIQEFGSDFYQNFDIVIAGLDNIKARRWLNAKLFSLVQYDDEGNVDPDTIIPLIDGGTEGFKGHVRMFIPGISSCFECSLDAIPRQTGYQLCTLQGKPRKPEHCVAYAKQLLWPRLKFLNGLEDGEWELAGSQSEVDGGVKFDSDDALHMTWMYQRALERADEFNIEGVTFEMTMQVTKNIIPAIASTNALISAACVAEAMKFVSRTSMCLENWLMYMGQNGTYSNTINYKKKAFCTICGEPKPTKLDPSTTLENFIEMLKYEDKMSDPGLSAPSFGDHGLTLFNPARALRKATEGNLVKTLGELFQGQEMTTVFVTDANLAGSIAKYNVIMTDGEFWEAPVENQE